MLRRIFLPPHWPFKSGSCLAASRSLNVFPNRNLMTRGNLCLILALPKIVVRPQTWHDIAPSLSCHCYWPALQLHPSSDKKPCFDVTSIFTVKIQLWFWGSGGGGGVLVDVVARRIRKGFTFGISATRPSCPVRRRQPKLGTKVGRSCGHSSVCA